MRFPRDRTKELIASPAQLAKSLTQVVIIGFLTVAALTPLANAQTPQYELKWLGEGRPRDINESGVVAFGYASAVYDHATGIKLDLDDPAYGATWIDLEDNGDETGQWTVHHCNGINESNQIIGTASHVNGAEANRHFVLNNPLVVLNDPLGPKPRFELIPRNILDVNQALVCINDLGQVAEGKEINNSGVVVAEDWVKLPDGTVLTFEGHDFTGINEAGMVTGYRLGINGGPPSGRRDGGPVLFHYQGNSELIVSGSETNYHGDVNNSGNVVFESGGGFIYIAGSSGPVNLNQLNIEAQSQQDYEDFINTGIQPTGINDAGQIIGQAQRGGVWHGFILTPKPSITVNDLAFDEGNVGTTKTREFTVTLSKLTDEDVMVPYEIVDGTASAGDDYTTSASSGLLTFAFSAGETSKTVQFAIIGDDTNEPDETFVIQLGEAIGGAVVSKSVGTVTIKNDDKKGRRK